MRKTMWRASLLLASTFGLTCAWAASDALDFQIHVNDPKLPNIVVVATGGTIAEKTDPKTGGAVPALSGQALVEAVPQLKTLVNVGVAEFSNIDSSQMAPEDWARLSRAVDKILERDDIVGVIVTHGTDTMAEGAYFLELTLKSDKAVVFTGAMNDASSPSPDGPGNILNAAIQVISDQSRDWGVTVTLNSFINSARGVRKTDKTNPQTFMSGHEGYLGYIVAGEVKRINTRLYRQKLSLPEALPKVTYLSTFSGDDGSLVKFAADSGAEGIVIDGVGAGNVNAAVFESVKYALSKNIAVVIGSRVYHGSVAPLYGDQGGGETLQNSGCILAGDLLGHKARLLLMLGIANYKGDPNKIKSLFSPVAVY